MKKITALLLIAVMSTVCFAGCLNLGGGGSARMIYYTFEGALSEATDVVVAQYIGSKKFGKQHIEHEFLVSERIYGEAPDTVRIHTARDLDIEVFLSGEEDGGYPVAPYNEKGIEFEKGVNYLLVLKKSDSNAVYKHTIPYIMVGDIMIDVDKIAESRMYYNEPINNHTEGIKFTESLTREELTEYIASITVNNVGDGFIRVYLESDRLEDIVNDSPNIIKVKIGELESKTRSDIFDIDFYECTVVETLKGDIKVGAKITIIFFANTVKTGKEYIVATYQIKDSDGNIRSTSHRLTSKKSLFKLNQYEEIMNYIK